VILHAYAVYGEACVERLAGMFAFALWDATERRLFLARDRLGKKPLYYWQRERLFLFASEPKALLCHPAVGRAVDWSALHHYLAFGYTPAARSIFDEIRKLPPAHTATFADGRLTERCYWRLPAAAAWRRARDARGERRGDPPRLREAVRLRLRATCRSACSSRAASTRARSSPACAR
jgi:asparagine synthase (glutamine-hydrolysing)